MLQTSIKIKILAAWRIKDFEKVNILQEILVKDFSARALAVRRISMDTNLIENKKLSTDKMKMETIFYLKNLSKYKAEPAKIINIPIAYLNDSKLEFRPKGYRIKL